ncbi:unnamed protein product [Rotaria socialis]|uniref:Poly A polymerase head domain-containing protein n=1 Tax=Rotaria socialis TaxID=392032 RepID=A0A821PSL7_9BILA|nr:unnamed protein product [Rotaria socialis]CAF4811911.1 unnamed protein product [Rotaria socialis]
MVINPHDVDFAATATPEQIKHMLSEPNIRMINANGEQHGTITTRIDDKDNFEITTLRVDVSTDRRHVAKNIIDPTSYVLYFEGIIYDYFNGIDGLERRRIRFVGDPVERIREDYLRIRRYFRGLRANANGLQNISGERLRVESKRTAEGRNAGPVLKKMLEQNISQYPDIPSNIDLNQIEDHWRKFHQIKPKAPTILTKLFLSKFEQRMKYFNEYRRLSQWLVAYRDSISILDSSSIDPLKPSKD